MEIKRIESQRSTKGPTDWFTGAVRIQPLFEPPEPARVRGASVKFEPGARTGLRTPAAKYEPRSALDRCRTVRRQNSLRTLAMRSRTFTLSMPRRAGLYGRRRSRIIFCPESPAPRFFMAIVSMRRFLPSKKPPAATPSMNAANSAEVWSLWMRATARSSGRVTRCRSRRSPSKRIPQERRCTVRRAARSGLPRRSI